MVIATIDYELGKPDSYNHIVLWRGGDTWAYFCKGLAYVDWADMELFLSMFEELPVYYDVSVYQFVQDGGVLASAVMPLAQIVEVVCA